MILGQVSAGAFDKTQCIICGKSKVTYDCKGCRYSFCINHLNEHKQQLDQQLDDVEHQRNLFKQKLNDQKPNIIQNSLLQQINQWEERSIRLIQQTAEETRSILHKYTNEQIPNIHGQLNRLTDEVKELQNSGDFNEIHLDNLRIKLQILEEQLNQPANIQIEEKQVLVKKINIITSTNQPNLPVNAKWNPNAITIAGEKGKGHALNQFHWPMEMVINNNDESIYVVDSLNEKRIVEWKKNAQTGVIVADKNDQLCFPIGLAIDHHADALIIADRDGKRVIRWPIRYRQSGQTIISNVSCWSLFINKNSDIYVSNYQKHEVRKWKIGDEEGTLVAGGNGKGNSLNQLDTPHCVFVDDNESVYVSDWTNERVMKWTKDAKEGIVVAGGNGNGNSLGQLSRPGKIFVDRSDTIYVADSGNNRVVRWLKGSNVGEVVVGGNGEGTGANQLYGPSDLCLDKNNNLYILDQGNSRIQKFSIMA